MNELYLRSYSTLWLKPGSNWQEIRGAYRALIKKWHPDRFQQDSKNRKISEEETMEITRAYKVLADYYREHGSTPTNPATAPTAPARAPEHMHRAATPVDVSANDAHAGHPIPSPVESAQWKTLFVLSAIALLFYLWLSDPADRDPGVGALPKNMVQDADLPAAGAKPHHTPQTDSLRSDRNWAWFTRFRESHQKPSKESGTTGNRVSTSSTAVFRSGTVTRRTHFRRASISIL